MKNKKLVCDHLLFFVTVALPMEVLAKNQTFGQIANNLLGSELIVRELIRAVCIIAGCALILGSLLQYKKHRQNPMEIRLGNVFTSLIAGIALIALSFIPFQFN